MNILVTGANGQLGNEMQICSKSSGDAYFFTDVCEGYEHLDITDLRAVRKYVRKNNIEAIVTRPAFSVLDKTKIRETFGVEVPYWTDSLKKCIESLKKD